MKTVLLTLLLSVSMVVFAQQPLDESETPESETDQTSDVAQQTEDQPPLEEPGEEPGEESGETEPSDKDFKPSEEISEDYPIPLPSDI